MRCRKRLGMLPVRDVSETLLPGAVQNPLLEGRGPSWPGCEIMLTWTQRRTPWRATVPRGRESRARDEQRRTRQSASLQGRAYPIGGRTPWRATVPRGRASHVCGRPLFQRTRDFARGTAAIQGAALVFAAFVVERTAPVFPPAKIYTQRSRQFNSSSSGGF